MILLAAHSAVEVSTKSEKMILRLTELEISRPFSDHFQDLAKYIYCSRAMIVYKIFLHLMNCQPILILISSSGLMTKWYGVNINENSKL